MTRIYYSEKVKLIEKSREAALSAVQIYNNPLTTFKSESYIVLINIAWTYLLHAYYRDKGIEYRYYHKKNIRKRFDRNKDGTYKYWELSKCISSDDCPLDEHTKNNLRFLIGIRNHIVHRNVPDLDGYISARYQACALNYSHYLKQLHGEKYSLDNSLALSLQFAQLDYDQQKVLKDKKQRIPRDIQSYIATFDKSLSDDQISNERYSYKLLFVKVNAKSKGQADRVIEFLDPKSDLAKSISKDYWIIIDREKPKFLPSQVVQMANDAGFPDFKVHHHTDIWKKHDGKNPKKGFGVMVANTWYWYENWVEFVMDELSKM